jgi:hypothetical protein
MTEPVPTPCDAFEDLVQRVLDRELPLTALETPHAAACPECRGLASAARVLAGVPATSFDPPVELADRITSAVEGDYRTRRRWRVAGRAVAAALAASVLVAGFVYLRPAERLDVVEAPPRQLPQPTTAPPPRVADRFAEAGSAFASLTRKATDQTVAPTRQLLPSPTLPFSPMGDVPGVEPATESLASVPSAAKSGFEPLATTTRRAMNLFMRDTGLSAPPKPKS